MSSSATTSVRPKRRITFRRVTIDHVGDRNEPLVFCPRKLAVMPVTDCRRCDRFAGLCVNPEQGDSFLRCAFGDDEPVGCDAEHGPEHELPLGVLRAPVSEIMTAPVCWATPDTSLEDLASMFLAEQIGAIPVVDAGRPIGIVSKTDTMQRYYDEAESQSFADAVEVLEQVDSPYSIREPIVALDIMTRSVFSVSPETSISRAAALMAYERVHHVLIVSPDGTMRGIVSTLDIARWVARADGYVVPRRPRLPT
ncbi:MAG TPA: CBS domain-containing protein [Polyangiales bacterium]|nr:CBS domain-containing protein [Polyangiales bacterium]